MSRLVLRSPMRSPVGDALPLEAACFVLHSSSINGVISIDIIPFEGSVLELRASWGQWQGFGTERILD